jgi:hypothetical protein
MSRTKILKTKQKCHPWNKWECFAAGFYGQEPPDGMTPDEAKLAYAKFYLDGLFEDSTLAVFKEWPVSSENFLTNPHFNRLAWLGQASAFLKVGVPRFFRSAYYDLPIEVQNEQNEIAAMCINRWIRQREDKAVHSHMGQKRLF